MRHVSLDNVEPGQVLAKSIYSSDGRTLLNTGVQLTVGMINKLRRVGVTMVYIQDSQFQDIKIQDVVSDETRREALSTLSQAFQFVQEGKNLDTRQINHTATNIIDEIMRNRNVLLHLSDIRTYDNHLFIHSLNVCIMSILIGVNMGLNLTQLKDLAVGALLHDIGKAPERVREEEVEEVVHQTGAGQTVPAAINEYPGGDVDDISVEGDAHTNYDDHTWKGFNALRRKHEVSIVAAHVALQHHEHIDGTGQPRGLSEEEIHPFAKIVSVANYYDNLISPFSTEPAYVPHEACEHLMGLANKRFDHGVVIHFLRSIAAYPTGTSVRLSTGDVGVVVGQHKGLPTRPVIRVIKKTNFDGEESEPKVFEIDLAKETTVFIKEVLDS
ncbi:MAG: HD domain-containing protein [Bacillaceae bacterium]|nr:HD domain-containing protein [Bacillaceae bacterium]